MRIEETDFILTESEMSGLAAYFKLAVNRFSVIPELEIETSVQTTVTSAFKKLPESDQSRLENIITALSSPLRLVNMNYTIADESISRQVLAWPPSPKEELVFLASNGVEWRVGTRSSFQIQSMIQGVLAAGDTLRREPLNQSVSTVAVITLLAMLDQLRYARLHSQLLHEEPIESVAVFELLARVEESETEDFRWSLPFVEKGLPLEFTSMFSEQNVIDGLQELIQTGLVQALDDTVPATLYALTTEGKVIADTVLHDVSKLLLTFSDAMEEGETGHDVMFFVRGSLGLFLFMMSGEVGVITGMEGEQLKSFLEEIFIPPPKEAVAALSLTQTADTQSTSEETTDTTSVIGPLKTQQEYTPRPGKICQYCQNPISDKARFCDTCGKPVAIDLVETSEPPSTPERVCPHCHQLIGEKAKFCGGCGKPVE